MRQPHPTPGWLTGALQSAVASVTETEAFETPPSRLTRLTVSYAAGAASNAPRRLLLKVPKPHKTQRFLREVRFYDRVAPRLGGAGLVRCLASSGGTASEPPWLLLQDMSTTHRAPVDGSVADLRAAAAALANLHAALWGRADLEEVAGETAEAALRDDLAGNERRFAELADIFGARLPDSWRRLYQCALDAAPALLLARLGQGHLTLCHPDAHSGNFLLPRAGGGPALLVDWHGYSAGWGAGDMARLLLGDVGAHRAHERQVLEHYHATLCAAGVSGYGVGDLWRDYRLSLLHNLFTPLGSRRQPWAWDQMGQAVAAFEDCQCAELLEGADRFPGRHPSLDLPRPFKAGARLRSAEAAQKARRRAGGGTAGRPPRNRAGRSAHGRRVPPAPP